MNSYAIYRIAETIRVLLFMTLSILVFNFYPVTAVMIVLLALLNDGAILSIAYDNVTVQASQKPGTCGRAGHGHCAWVVRFDCRVWIVLSWRTCLSCSTGRPQTLMYLKAIRGRAFDYLRDTDARAVLVDPPCADLMVCRLHQALATMIAAYGLLMTPMGWGWAAFVWGYALVVPRDDRVKLVIGCLIVSMWYTTLEPRSLSGPLRQTGA